MTGRGERKKRSALHALRRCAPCVAAPFTGTSWVTGLSTVRFMTSCAAARHLGFSAHCDPPPTRQLLLAPHLRPPPTPPTSAVDEGSGQTYYYSASTGATSCVVLRTGAAQPLRAPAPARALRQDLSLSPSHPPLSLLHATLCFCDRWEVPEGYGGGGSGASAWRKSRHSGCCARWRARADLHTVEPALTPSRSTHHPALPRARRASGGPLLWPQLLVQ